MSSTVALGCGIAYSRTDSSRLEHLPLQQTQVHAEIVDVSAVVTLTQIFWQYSSYPTGRAKYVFPIPARAAICGFEMRTQTGKVIKAVAKEKEEAKQAHESALRKGKMTGLVEHVTDDIFTASLGALPGPQMITTTLTYVMDLMDGDLTDQVRFQLPRSVGMRYGSLPLGMQDASTYALERVKISASIQMSGTIRTVESPSHLLNTYRSADVDVPTYTESATPYRVDYDSSVFLSTDFVLVIKADGLDAPRVFAERHPNGSLAIQLTLVPKLDLPRIAAQEYIFLVDRSGSMSGSRITSAKNTLVMLLRALPSQGTTFNIFSFGDKCDSIWSKSQAYTEQALKYATQMVDLMRANYGGTEIREALKKVLKSRSGDVPAACFLLTDGEAHDVEATIETVTKAVRKAKAKAPLRVFTLGIGGTTSTAMCEGIARAGNGICLMAVTSESIVGKCSKLVRASRTYILKDIKVDWAAGGASKKTQALRQAPQEISSMYSGTRAVVFALIRPPAQLRGSIEKLMVPKEITLQAQQDGNGGTLKLKFPVLELPYKEGGPHLIHTLAARRIIQELTDGKSTEKFTTAKTTIIQLGTQYQLTSPYTSFVAVDHGSSEVSPPYDDDRPPSPEFVKRDSTGDNAGTGHAAFSKRARRNTLSVFSGGGPTLMRHASNSSGSSAWFKSKAVRSSATSSIAPQLSVSAPLGPQQTSYPVARRMLFDLDTQPTSRSVDNQGMDVYSPLCCDSPEPESRHDTAMINPMVSEAKSRARASIPRQVDMYDDNGEEYGYRRQEEYAATRRGLVRQDNDRTIVDLVRLQAFNGSFSPGPDLEKFVGSRALQEGKTLGVDMAVWATVLAVVYLKKHLADEPELLDGLLDKAMGFLSASPGVDIPTVMEYARPLVK